MNMSTRKPQRANWESGNRTDNWGWWISPCSRVESNSLGTLACVCGRNLSHRTIWFHYQNSFRASPRLRVGRPTEDEIGISGGARIGASIIFGWKNCRSRPVRRRRMGSWGIRWMGTSFWTWGFNLPTPAANGLS